VLGTTNIRAPGAGTDPVTILVIASDPAKPRAVMTATLRSRRAPQLCAALVLSALMLACGSDDEASDAGGTASDASDDSEGESDDSGSASARDAGQAGSADGGGRDAASARDAGNVGDAGNARDAASENLSDAGGASGTDSAVAPSGLPHFSFFVTSQAAIVELAKNPKGFGGDLRYGETGGGAGLRGADKICGEIAERSMPGASKKQWRAFLSASAGGANGGAVNARDRIGSGPWYDRGGRLVGNALGDLLSGDRPANADAMIRDDLPNETGTSNSTPDGTKLDNHDTLTGSDSGGRYVSGSNTCQDWSSVATTSTGGGGGGGSGPSIGHSWPRSATNGRNWVSDHKAGGCGQGINTSNGTSDGTATVGSGGGYGGFYCFALEP
jgi:hypothetical protein